MTPTEQKAFDDMRETFKPFEKLFKQMTDVHPTPTNFDCQIAVRDLRALIYSFDDLTAANAVSDHFRGVTEMVQPLGWYCVSRDGLATQCADQRDAEVTAESANRDWPNSAPYRAVQLCEFEANPQATEPAWRLIESAPKSGSFLVGVWEGDWKKPKQRFVIYQATGWPSGPLWAMKGNYRTEEGGAYKLACWMPLPAAPEAKQ